MQTTISHSYLPIKWQETKLLSIPKTDKFLFKTKIIGHPYLGYCWVENNQLFYKFFKAEKTIKNRLGFSKSFLIKFSKL